MPNLPTSQNFASVDFASQLPLPVFGGNVTGPNLVVLLIKNSTTSQAQSGFNFLKGYVNSELSSLAPFRNFTVEGLKNFSGESFGIYNVTHSVGFMIFQDHSYLCAVMGYNVPFSYISGISVMQAGNIDSVTSGYAL